MMRRYRPWVLVPALVFLFHGGAHGQTLRGVVHDAENGRPLRTAYIALVDQREAVVEAMLTGDDGSFRFRAPAPGPYRIMVRHIGYADTRSEVYQLDQEGMMTIELAVPPQPIPLDESITAEGRRECRIPRAEGGALWAAWDEALKALELTKWSTDKVRLEGTRFVRRLDPAEEMVLDEDSQRFAGWGNHAFHSPPAEKLAEEGWVVEEEGNLVFYGPDVEALLSEAFLRTHCFRLTFREGRIGIRFDPSPDRRVPDIFGVFWLDAASAELLSVEFSYQGVDVVDALPVLWSEVHFSELDSGAWIVRSWVIRMPEIGHVWNGHEYIQGLRAIQEEGGRVTDAGTPLLRD